MQSKKLIFSIAVFSVLLGVAAFTGGKLLNQRVGPVGLGAPFQGDFRSIIVPAPELPATQPDMTGVVVERKDNTIIVETKSLEVGGGVADSTVNGKNQSGPVIEVVFNDKTVIYRETTQPDEPLSAENQRIQQTVEQAPLDDLDAHARSMIMVWGRKSGDRIIADVLMYSDLVAIKSAIFEDCEICP